MRWRKPGIWIGIASLLLVVGFVAWDARRISPGELSAVHERAREGLARDCEACHGEAGATLASGCATCHEDVARQIAAREGLHGTMAADVTACGTCHSEHHGPDHPLVSDHVFAQAGVGDRARFRHEGLAFRLGGDHVDLACERCHEHANDAVLAAGNKRFLGESQECSRCHRDPHQGKLPGCAGCHGESEPFETVAAFQHPSSFALTGKHARTGCLQCHQKDGPFAIEASGLAGGTPRTTRAARACRDCHASPHTESFVTLAATRLGVAAEASCAACHSVEDETFESPAARLEREQHAASGFALVPPHEKVGCEQCHVPGPLLPAPSGAASASEAFRALHPGRRADDCRACHLDPHGGQFATGAFAGAQCTACHEALRFTPAAFGLESHARTSFALTGAHGAVACSRCHAQPEPGAPRQFHGTSTACASCHADAHRGFFERPGVPAIFRGEAGCARCHDTTTFGPVATRPFDHALWTGFPLEGAHARGACTDCHARTKADETGRTFGRVAASAKAPAGACVTCHADVHAGAFDGHALASSTDRGAGCARCHDVESFHRARLDFDHARWTRFALTGAHAAADCESCHVPRARPDAAGRTFGLVAERFPGSAERCDTCHTDVHGGSFRSQRCDECHTTASFQEVPAAKFDHARATGFALEGAHARAECSRCHAEQHTREGRKLGRAMGRDCQACHAEPHVGQFSAAGRTDCARCHAPSETFDRPHFDHARDSRFALDATHERLACSKCHRDTPLQSGGSAIRYKPLGTTCADCHVPTRR